MEKILNLRGLGVSGRQNELIELALTFKFNTVEVDMNDLVGRHDTMGKEFACQFLRSAKINIGTFELPIDLDVEEAKYQSGLGKLETIFALCQALGGKRCRLPIGTSSDEPFQKCFERHRTRLYELGEKFASAGIVIGLALQRPAAKPKDYKFIQSPDELVTLMKTVGHPAIGICLDTWHWRAAGGGMDQISDLDVSKITELTMADLQDTVDPAKITIRDRVLPGDLPNSFSLKVFDFLKSARYSKPISFATHLVTFANVSRDLICNRISKRLDCMISGESFDTIVERPLSQNVGQTDDSTEAEAGVMEEQADDALTVAE